MTALLGLSHLMVDLGCAFLVAHLAEGDLMVALLLYNFCAFALQMPLGIIVEGRFPPLKTAAVGIGLVVVSYAFTDITLLALVIAGVGNALFHLGGGLSVMNRSERAAPLGAFISPGALGLFLGALLGGGWRVPILLILALLALVLSFLKEDVPTLKPTASKSTPEIILLLALFVVVALRGFLGLGGEFSWRAEYALPFVLAVVLGKAIGGFLADRFGAKIVGIVSLIVSFLCFLRADIIPLGLIGVFSFQLTMPITLWAVTRVTAKGFGFGLLTFALFIGSLPLLLNSNLTLAAPIIALISLIFFVIGFRKGAL